ncbi:hypothetical protein NDK43_20670 [Neobacillus pocheonensis]|uniref:Uncharacterized protein n=1 Tax=Neobacillus pocheonensis TaxID=363869 RepID=A0ABT0WFG5_9BACI|nr:hypothetical protein [Neobacillus pocheonensis]
MDYSYKEFLEDLKMGKTMHFMYEDERYCISNWGFWKVQDASSKISNDGEEDILNKVKLDGKSIVEIWSLIQINHIF